MLSLCILLASPLAEAFATFAAPSPTALAVEAVFKGVVKGFADEEFSDIATCVGDLESSFDDFKEAVADFELKTAAGILDGLESTAKGLESLVAGLKACNATVTEVEKLVAALKQFQSPAAFAYHVGQDLLLNGRDIFQEISTAVDDYKAADYEGFGEQVGHALAKLIVGDSAYVSVLVSEQASPSPETLKVEAVFKGVVAGFAGEEIPDFEQCFGDLEQCCNIFEQAVVEFELKTVAGVLEGLKDIATGLEDLVAGLQQCNATVSEVEKMVASLEQFKTPSSFAYHIGQDLIVNGKDIFTEIDTAVSDWKAADYEGFGEQVGKALAQLVVGRTDVRFANIVAVSKQ